MFYREASLFVAYLKQLDDAKFKDFLLAIEGEVPFGTAFKNAYGTDVRDVWLGFLVEMKKPNNAFNTDLQKWRFAPLLLAG